MYGTAYILFVCESHLNVQVVSWGGYVNLEHNKVLQ